MGAAAVDRDTSLADAERERLNALDRAGAKAALDKVKDRDNERMRVMLAQPELCMIDR